MSSPFVLRDRAAFEKFVDELKMKTNDAQKTRKSSEMEHRKTATSDSEHKKNRKTLPSRGVAPFLEKLSAKGYQSILIGKEEPNLNDTSTRTHLQQLVNSGEIDLQKELSRIDKEKKLKELERTNAKESARVKARNYVTKSVLAELQRMGSPAEGRLILYIGTRALCATIIDLFDKFGDQTSIKWHMPMLPNSSRMNCLAPHHRVEILLPSLLDEKRIREALVDCKTLLNEGHRGSTAGVTSAMLSKISSKILFHYQLDEMVIGNDYYLCTH